LRTLYAETARHEIARKELAAPKMQGWNMRDMESTGKAEYGKPLTAQYRDFTHVIRYAFHQSRFQDSTCAASTSIL